MPHTVNDIIEAFGGLQPASDALGLSYEAIKKWRQRQSIPGVHRYRIEAAAKRHRLRGITARRLAEIAGEIE